MHACMHIHTHQASFSCHLSNSFARFQFTQSQVEDLVAQPSAVLECLFMFDCLDITTFVIYCFQNIFVFVILASVSSGRGFEFIFPNVSIFLEHNNIVQIRAILCCLFKGQLSRIYGEQ